MGKSVKKPEIRKKELIDIAFKQFIERGYEKTSIRSIVGEANGEIGMFYHYFASKEEIFNSVLEQYNTTFVEKLKCLVSNSKKLPFSKLLDSILFGLGETISEYSSIQPDTVNTQTLTILHHNTLLVIQPIFCEIIEDYVQRGEIQLPDVNAGIVANFLLYGMSAIIHDHQIENMDIKIKAIHALFGQMLSIRLEE